MPVTFRNYSRIVLNRINDNAVSWLEEASGELEAQTKQNTKVDTGKTKGSWEHRVDTEKMVGEVGSRYKNALWEEYGTGIHALHGDGRNTPWVYKNPKDNKFYFTVGKKPRRALFNAYTSLKNRLIRSAQERFRRL